MRGAHCDNKHEHLNSTHICEGREALYNELVSVKEGLIQARMEGVSNIMVEADVEIAIKFS